MSKKTLVSIVAFVVIVTLACGSSGTPTIKSPSNQPEITITITGTSTEEIASEEVSQPNCGGTAEVETVVERSRAVEHTVEATGSFSVNSNGQIGFAGTDIELGATIAAELGTTYGTTETIRKALTVKASPGSNMAHTIKQTEIWEIGTAKIVVGDQETTVPFRFRNDFSVDLVSSKNDGCNGQPANPTPTITTSIESTLTSETPITVTSDQVVKSISINKTKNSSNYDGQVILTLEKIETLANNRMRWYLSFFNHTDRDASMEFSDEDRYSNVVDELGTRYLILSQEPAGFIASYAPAGTKISGWIEFDLPTNGAKTFKLSLERWTFGSQQLTYDTPLEISLSDPLYP
jgi:hypothetical protein